MISNKWVKKCGHPVGHSCEELIGFVWALRAECDSSPRMEYHKFIPFFAALSRVAGFRFSVGKGSSLPPRLFAILSALSDILMSFYVFRIVSKLFLTPMNLDQILEWISTFLYVGQAFLKALLLRYYNADIQRCMYKMNAFFEMVNQRDRDVFGVIWRAQYNLPNRFCMIIFSTQMACLVLAYAPSFYNTVADPTAAFITFPSYYYFYDWHYGVKVGYLVLDFITSNLCCLKTSAVEMLYLTLVSFYVAALKYLRLTLHAIFNDFVAGRFHEARYKWWLEAHVDTLLQIAMFKKLVRFLLLIIYIYNLLNIVTMFIFVTADGDMEVSQKMVAIVVVTVTLFYFFWDCVLTDELEALHSSVMFEAYRAELAFMERSHHHRGVLQGVLLGTTRCRLPLKITAGGVFAPSCPNFKELMTTTGSFLVALWEIKNRAVRQNEINAAT